MLSPHARMRESGPEPPAQAPAKRLQRTGGCIVKSIYIIAAATFPLTN